MFGSGFLANLAVQQALLQEDGDVCVQDRINHARLLDASLLAGWYLADLPQTDHVAVTRALHAAFLTLGGLTILSSLSFWTLRAGDGHALTAKPDAPVATREPVAD